MQRLRRRLALLVSKCTCTPLRIADHPSSCCSACWPDSANQRFRTFDRSAWAKAPTAECICSWGRHSVSLRASWWLNLLMPAEKHCRLLALTNDLKGIAACCTHGVNRSAAACTSCCFPQSRDQQSDRLFKRCWASVCASSSGYKQRRCLKRFALARLRARVLVRELCVLFVARHARLILTLRRSISS